MENIFNQFEGAVTICDTKGIITFMNNVAIAQFAKYGGNKLIGQNLLDCHPEPSKTKLKNMLIEPKNNIYTIEKTGRKKIIHQSPLFENGEFCGLIEMSYYLPENMEHFVRG